MGAFTGDLTNKLLAKAFGAVDFTPAPIIYVAAYTSLTNATVTGTEVSGGGYTRLAIPNNPANFVRVNDYQYTNAVLLSWPTATASWGTISHVAFWSTATGTSGTKIAFDDLTLPEQININNELVIKPGTLLINLTSP